VILAPKKKLQNRPLSFATIADWLSKANFWYKKKTRGTSLRVPRQRRPSQNWLWRPKLSQIQNLGDGFVVFFRGPKS